LRGGIQGTAGSSPAAGRSLGPNRRHFWPRCNWEKTRGLDPGKGPIMKVKGQGWAVGVNRWGTFTIRQRSPTPILRSSCGGNRDLPPGNAPFPSLLVGFAGHPETSSSSPGRGGTREHPTRGDKLSTGPVASRQLEKTGRGDPVRSSGGARRGGKSRPGAACIGEGAGDLFVHRRRNVVSGPWGLHAGYPRMGG